MNWKEIRNIICECGKKFGDWLKNATIFLFDLIIMIGVFMGRLWRPITIIAVAFIFIAFLAVLTLILWDRLPRSVFFALLLVTVILGVIILFKKQIFGDFPSYLNKCWSKCDKKQVVNIIAAIIVLIPIWWQFSSQTNILDAQKVIAKNQFAADLFKNAIDQLGSEQQPIVLGGVHSLHHLAMNNEKDYSQPVFEILCSFIREKTAKLEYKEQFLATSDSSGETQATSLIVIQTIVDKLFREEDARKYYEEYKANLSGSFLPEVNLTYAKLQKADLREANLQGANLFAANLQQAELNRANLQGANLFLLCQLTLTRFKLFATNAFRREKGVIFSMESDYGKTLYD